MFKFSSAKIPHGWPDVRRGIIGLMTVIIIGVVILTVGLVVSYAGQTQISVAGMFEREQSAREVAAACLEEVTYRLAIDPGYAGGTVPIGILSCSSTVTGSDNTRQVTVTANDGDMSAAVEVNLQRRQNPSGNAYGWSVESWQETLP